MTRLREKALPKSYLEIVSRRNWAMWLWALIGALAMNTALFATMPCLLRPAQVPPEFEQIIPHVSVVRVKRPETPVKKEIEKQKPEEQPKAQKHPDVRTAKPEMGKLDLHFEINPRLPAAPNTVALPEMPPPEFEISGLDGAFSAGELDEPLTVLSRIPPVYPAKAKHREIEGWVRVRLLVREDGTVGNVAVVESDPPGIFDESVIRCVSNWRFKPGAVEGIAVKTWAETTVRFQLE